MSKREKPIKCEYCGKFISYADISSDNTISVFEPDSEFSLRI